MTGFNIMIPANLPQDLKEANTRIIAYMDKLQLEGKTFDEAYQIAFVWWRKIKHYYAGKKADEIGHCKICGYPILHQVDEYAVCATSASNVEMWHTLCETESIEQMPEEVKH